MKQKTTKKKKKKKKTIKRAVGAKANSTKELERQLLQSEKLASIGLVVGGILHDLNNPIAGIMLFSEVMLRGMAKSDPHYKDAKEIEAAAQRCKVLLSELLNYIRANQQGREEKLRTAEVTAAVESALRFGKLHRYAKKVKVREERPKEAVWVKGNANSLIQLFLNLIQNAYQAMPQGGSLDISYHPVKRGKVLFGQWEFQDSGVGISSKNMKRIFDPFFTTKKADEGTGLGLSICRRICRNLGGTLEIKSKEGVGTTCFVSLPIASAPNPKELEIEEEE